MTAQLFLSICGFLLQDQGQLPDPAAVTVIVSGRAEIHEFKKELEEIGVEPTADKHGFLVEREEKRTFLIDRKLVRPASSQVFDRVLQFLSTQRIPAVFDLGALDAGVERDFRELLRKGPPNPLLFAAAEAPNLKVGAEAVMRAKIKSGGREIELRADTQFADQDERANAVNEGIGTELIDEDVSARFQREGAAEGKSELHIFITNATHLERRGRTFLIERAMATLKKKQEEEEERQKAEAARVAAEALRKLAGEDGSWDGASDVRFRDLDGPMKDFLKKELLSQHRAQFKNEADVTDFLNGAVLLQPRTHINFSITYMRQGRRSTFSFQLDGSRF